MDDGGDGADHPAALQGILRKLSTGLDNLIAGTSFPRMRSLLADLKSGDDSRTIGALSELCNMLSMATDESMIAFSVDQFVSVLVELLSHDSNPNIMLLAARSLTNLIEVLPAAGEMLVHRGAVPILVSKLLCIEYMDVAEQALECLERLSRENAQSILQSGGLTAALAFLDFFSTGLQCVSLNLAANICHSMQPSGCDLVVESIPVLTNVLMYQDNRIVDSAISCFHSLSRAFKNSEEDLTAIAAHGLLNRVLEVVAARESMSGAAHRPANFTMLIQILSFHCRHSADTVQTVINSGMIDTLHSVLSASAVVDEEEGAQIKIAARPSEQLAEILQLCYELLPPLPPAMAKFVWSRPTLAELDLEQYEGDMHPKTLMFHKQPSLLITYGESLFGLLLQVYAESMALNVRNRALASISAIVYHMTAPMLDSLLARKPFSSFCADLLASGEAPIAMTALQMCSVLMDRLPVIFHHQLLREGVIDAIRTMRSAEGVHQLFTCDEEHTAMLSECASQFWSTHVLPSLESSGAVTKTVTLSKLLVLSAKLADHGLLGAECGADASTLLTDIFQLLVAGEGVSVFEFHGSKLTEALLAFLDPMHEDLQHRIGCVLDCAIRTGSGEPDPASGGLQRVASATSTQPITVLVRLLSGCVDKLEHFSVMLHSSVTNLAVGLKVLTQPFKLCLKRDPSESSQLHDYSSNVVLIEPLATVTAVEEFLWSKVHEADADEVEAESLDGAAPRGKRLTLRMQGKQLEHKSTIFQAIYEAWSNESVEGEEEYKISHKVWEQVHIITYSLHKPEDSGSPGSPVWNKLAAQQSNQQVHTSSAALAAQVLLKVSDASSNTKEWGFLSTALHLLSTLNWMCSLWHNFCSKETLHQIIPTGGLDTRGGDSSALLASHCFVSPKLTNKLMRQLQDPLVLCSGGLPAWCPTLVSNAGFVLPFECRRLFFQYTSLGISRALHIMQHRAQQSENGLSSPTRSASLSNNSEFRLGRIQRQKARVHRLRILMSAVKVLELCTGHKAVLEVEFSGEAGTGTGPTLEFFTLVSREIQRKDLGMWFQSETSKHLAPRTMETELVYTPPAEDVHMHNVHRIAVLHCSQCNHTEFPMSQHSGELLTVSLEEGQAAACTQDPSEPQVRADSVPCTSCNCEQPLSLLWWVVFDDEAQYLAKAFPSGVATLQHMVLQCPQCKSVNFPGTEHTLTINRNGKMFSASGRRLHEHEYRAVTQHASSLCENLPLKQVPVALTQQVVDAMVQALLITPELIEEPTDNEFRDSNATGVKEYVHIGDGMFPQTVAPGQSCEDVAVMFQFLGRFVAKAVMDGRLVDLPFNRVFWKAVLMRDLSLSDIASIDRQLSTSLEAMHQLGVQYDTAAKMENPVDRQAAIDAITLDGAKVQDLCLDFTLPGRPEIELVLGGADREVTLESIGEYVQLVAQMLLHDGVQQQVEAFRAGFIDILPLDGLLNFSEEEIETLVCGDSKFWDVSSFIEQIHCDRGFNPESPAIKHLAEVLDEMNSVEKRLFLRFATGSPKLPVDGLRGLNPPLTVVLKPPEQGWTPDDYLPSVMTCTNYLKLPNYSTKDVMRDKLMMAIKEGHISFHLS